jgi:hypothetical protein
VSNLGEQIEAARIVLKAAMRAQRTALQVLTELEETLATTHSQEAQRNGHHQGSAHHPQAVVKGGARATT